MSKENSLITASLDIDKDDILTVVLARAEAKMQKQIATADKNVKNLQKELNKAQADLDANLNKAAEAHFRRAASKFVEAFDAANVKATTTAKYTGLNKDETFNVVLSVASRVVSFNCAETIPLEDRPRRMLAAIATMNEEIAAARQELIDWRRRASQLPALERQYRAKLVESKLSETEDGQKILASLDLDSLNESILGLPAV